MAFSNTFDTTNTGSAVSNREDLTDVLTILAPEETPVLSSANKSKASATNVDNATSKGGLDYVNNVSNSGVVGQLYGLNVVMNHYIPKNRFGVFDMSVKPVAYVERRGLTVEEANPGFGITGSYMSMRYGLKVIRPEAGVIVIGD